MKAINKEEFRLMEVARKEMLADIKLLVKEVKRKDFCRWNVKHLTDAIECRAFSLIEDMRDMR
jgi:hypothetical protein